ncbi:hypothetical protein G6F70_001911 [Rhizopus microsporus]|uniref:Uncharacterized protein n=2 Tax=Rhizopus TaxID=4842 RepID=A0A0A1PEX2_RHIZD|nr:hypothetical protein G6F71_006513 [Rhizopus microsporus]KAG1202824.1 hypothetical protein G6F70_001911 [Rhizopus microsporus]KAG1209349.1 hypothetical protein G6F69_006426 [Rhizopus microsporus]KAG1230810.1 hypothetical protein G6F67_006208 [Rhizopus microsporus]KAG1263107.1 hypothetical protein G6F68_005395 [Rhizopus microsporus]
MSARENEQRAKEAVDKTAHNAKEELERLRAEYEDLKRRTQPKVQEAQSYLTSPSAIGFYQGVIVGAFLVLGYAKYKGGLLLA